MEYQPSYSDSLRADILPSYSDSLMHHGVKGMKWGVRRYQNRDGSYTSAGKKHRKSKSSLMALDAKTKKRIAAGLALVGTGMAAKTLYDEYKTDIDAAIANRKGGYDSQGIGKRYDKAIKSSILANDKIINEHFVEGMNLDNPKIVHRKAEDIHYAIDDAIGQINRMRNEIDNSYDITELNTKDRVLVNKNIKANTQLINNQENSWRSLAYELEQHARELESQNRL